MRRGQPRSGAILKQPRPLSRSGHGFLLLLILGALLQGSTAQFGDICGCQPGSYDMILDFSVACEDASVGGPGVNATSCIASRVNPDMVTDFTPVVVTSIQILELNAFSRVIKQTALTGLFLDGARLSYRSVLDEYDTFNATTFPRSFQMIFQARNAQDQPIRITWLVVYSNSCDVFPVIYPGQTEGLIVFVSSICAF